jgi:hypothetical protein
VACNPKSAGFPALFRDMTQQRGAALFKGPCYEHGGGRVAPTNAQVLLHRRAHDLSSGELGRRARGGW